MLPFMLPLSGHFS